MPNLTLSLFAELVIQQGNVYSDSSEKHAFLDKTRELPRRPDG